MNRQIEIAVSNLSSDRVAMGDELKGIGEDLKNLLEEMNQLNATWEGPSNVAYQNQVASDVENLSGLCKGLGKFLECTAYAEQSYVKCEKEVTSYIDRLWV